MIYSYSAQAKYMTLLANILMFLSILAAVFAKNPANGEVIPSAVYQSCQRENDISAASTSVQRAYYEVIIFLGLIHQKSETFNKNGGLDG